MLVSGVRSSCEASATNSRWRLDHLLGLRARRVERRAASRRASARARRPRRRRSGIGHPPRGVAGRWRSRARPRSATEIGRIARSATASPASAGEDGADRGPRPPRKSQSRPIVDSQRARGCARTGRRSASPPSGSGSSDWRRRRRPRPPGARRVVGRGRASGAVALIGLPGASTTEIDRVAGENQPVEPRSRLVTPRAPVAGSIADLQCGGDVVGASSGPPRRSRLELVDRPVARPRRRRRAGSTASGSPRPRRSAIGPASA